MSDFIKHLIASITCDQTIAELCAFKFRKSVAARDVARIRRAA